MTKSSCHLFWAHSQPTLRPFPIHPSLCHIKHLGCNYEKLLPGTEMWRNNELHFEGMAWRVMTVGIPSQLQYKTFIRKEGVTAQISRWRSILKRINFSWIVVSVILEHLETTSIFNCQWTRVTESLKEGSLAWALIYQGNSAILWNGSLCLPIYFMDRFNSGSTRRMGVIMTTLPLRYACKGKISGL